MNPGTSEKMSRSMNRISHGSRLLREWLQRPVSVFTVATGLAFGAVLLDGTLFRLWSLTRDRDRLVNRIENLKLSIADKEKKIVESNRPDFIERQAREQLDFVRDGDLVFVFSNNDIESDPSSSQNASR